MENGHELDSKGGGERGGYASPDVRIAAAAEAAADSSSITAAVAATVAAATAFAYPLYNLYQPLHSSPLSSSNVSMICSLPSIFRNEP